MTTLTATTTFRPKNYELLFSKFKKPFMLSIDEYAFLAELRKVKNDSMWGLAIKSVIDNYSIERFRQLVCELLSQQSDDYMTLENIIGEKASKALLKLRP